MMHTEDEARTKWCPFARVVGQDMNGEREYEGNRVYLAPDDTSLDDILGHFSAKCAGSACMAWRPIMTYETVIGERDKKPEGDGWDWDTFSDDRWERPVPTGKGYCGLAGRPA